MLVPSYLIFLFILCIVFCSAMLGMWVSRRLPAHHMAAEVKSTVSVSMAIVGTMTALVISFLITSANSSFKSSNDVIFKISSDISQIDGFLRRYGPETEPIRESLQRLTALVIEGLFSDKASGRHTVDSPDVVRSLGEVQDRILALKPSDDRLRWLRAESLNLAASIGSARSLMVQQEAHTNLPLTFIGAVAVWMVVIFGSFGFFAPRNVTTVVSLLLSTLAVAMAFKIILDLDHPYDHGVRLSMPPIHISSEPLRHTLEKIRQ